MNVIRAIQESDRPRLEQIMKQSWGSTQMVTRGRAADAASAPGFIAESQADWLGYVGFELHGGAMEILILEAIAQGQGVGSALLAACVGAARDLNVDRLWLITTNDNIDAIRFYQRRGFVLLAVHRDAVTQVRAQFKPDLPLVGFHGIPLRDEIELELPRGVWDDFIERYSWPS